MVLHIIGADILRVARVPKGRGKIRAMSKMLYEKPSNKRSIIPLQKVFVILTSLFW